MDKAELKRRTVVDWRRYHNERDALDAIVLGDDVKLAEIRACAIKCRAWVQALHDQIDASDQAAVDKICSEFKAPKLEDL